MTRYKETEIAAVIVEWLQSQDWEVFQEVQPYQYSSVADIVAIKNEQVWVIETKTSFNLQVIAQAESWDVHLRSVGIPEVYRQSLGRDFAEKVCRNYGIGILAVSVPIHEVIAYQNPVLRKGYKRHADAIKNFVTEHHKNSKAGSTSGNHLTPYKLSMMKIRKFVEDNPGCTLNDIIDNLGNLHYSSEHSAKNAIRTALFKWESWCESRLVSGRGYRYFIKQEEIRK